MNKIERIEEMATDLSATHDYEGCEAWHCGGCEYERYGEYHFCSSIKQAEKMIARGYCKQRENKWINVKDRLPEKEQVVLCCLGLVMNVYTYKGDNTWEDDYGYWQKDEPITHWMPLPELPKN